MEHRRSCIILWLFTVIFPVSRGYAASHCAQEQIKQQNCVDCQISPTTDPTIAGLPAELAPLRDDAPQGLVTDFVNDHAGMKVIALHPFRKSASTSPMTIDVDPKERHQTMWGYGAALTDACVANLEKLGPVAQHHLMMKVFDQKQGAGFNYLRVPIGANDFALTDYTLDDTPGNAPDPTLSHFDFSHEADTLKFLREAKKINPEVEFMATPWTAPAWMKTTSKLDGGILMPQYYQAYAAYLIKALERFQKEGVPIDTLSALNEPLIHTAATHWGFPQMYISSDEMMKFLNDDLAPMMAEARKSGRIKTKLLLHDHNWANGGYVGKMLDDKVIADQTAGVAFHCYGGSPKQMYSDVATHPDEPIFNTECTGMIHGGEGSGDFQWWMENQALDVTRGGVVGSLGWNLCLDNKGGPSNPGGCVGCRGMVTVNPDKSVTFNAEFNALAQVSRVVRRGAVRIGSTDTSDDGVTNAAFENPDGSIALVIRNEKSFPFTLTVREDDCDTTNVTLPANGAVSLIWNQKGGGHF